MSRHVAVRSRGLFASGTLELVGVAPARLGGRGGRPDGKESTRSAYVPGKCGIGLRPCVEIRRGTMCARGDSDAQKAARAKRSPFLPSIGRSHTWLRAGRVTWAAMTAERGRRSCRARTRRSPPQFEIGQRDVATFHRGRSKDRSNASRRLIARSPSIVSFG